MARTSTASVTFRNEDQGKLFRQLTGRASYVSFIERYATVRLDVTPIPPRDYKVVINGEDCPATERAVYRVVPGAVAVEVTRIGKPACNWSGSIASGREQLVNCAL